MPSRSGGLCAGFSDNFAKRAQASRPLFRLQAGQMLSSNLSQLCRRSVDVLLHAINIPQDRLSLKRTPTAPRMRPWPAPSTLRRR
jgi:hypothetical protein